jgi:hypothetical protein
MYGLVNRSLQSFIVSDYGQASWDAIRAAASVEEDSFVSMEAYPDALTYQLVGAASEHLSVGAEEILHGFGRHWVLVTGKESYGDFLILAGGSFPEFLSNLNNLHTRVALAFPALQPPEFRVLDNDGRQLRLQYISERDGLTPFVVGLLDGLGELFRQQVDVELIRTKEEAGFDEFHVAYQPISDGDSVA